ncbi:hypothetical protein ACFE04_031819 [Oxalis oulophora]
MELFSNLPNDIGRECLVRLRYDQFSKISTVCKDWNRFIHLPEFFHHRKVNNLAQKLIVFAQSRVDPNKEAPILKSKLGNPIYRLTLLEPETGVWCELPTVPDYPDGLPLFCQLAAVGSSLVVLGGLDGVTWEVSNSVFVFDFLSATWHRGTQMPGVKRSLFGCTADDDSRMVYVAGGHDEGKNALKSVIAYDVAKDEWVPLPDMASERDECKAVFHRGKVHVIGGYCTTMQGRFNKSAEVFDPATWQWVEQGRDDFLGVNMCPRTCAGSNDEDLYMCRGDDVAALRGSTWQPVARLPAELCNVAHVTKWRGMLLVIGSAGFGESHVAFMLDLEKYTWRKVETPEKFSGHVQAGCYLEM